jgi:hypothetical protein
LSLAKFDAVNQRELDHALEIDLWELFPDDLENHFVCSSCKSRRNPRSLLRDPSAARDRRKTLSQRPCSSRATTFFAGSAILLCNALLRVFNGCLRSVRSAGSTVLENIPADSTLVDYRFSCPANHPRLAPNAMSAVVARREAAAVSFRRRYRSATLIRT